MLLVPVLDLARKLVSLVLERGPLGSAPTSLAAPTRAIPCPSANWPSIACGVGSFFFSYLLQRRGTPSRMAFASGSIRKSPAGPSPARRRALSDVAPLADEDAVPGVFLLLNGPLLERLAENGPHQVEAEEADTPQSDDPCRGQHEAEDRVLSPGRVAEQFTIGSHLSACRSALSCSQRSGSLSLRRTRQGQEGWQGADTNMQRHGFHSPSIPDVSSGARPMLTRAAVMLPKAEQACSQPRAWGRARSGITSATRATPTANSPPTPRPVRNR